ncbi:MAG: HupE/UreJ family protein [Saprospiraceae bacterium]|nr:HupE/UreJ family protein [Saprospiraceae bacterium]
MRYRYHAIFMVGALMIAYCGQLWGHAKDQSYLYLRIYQDHIEGTVETTYKDLNLAMGTDLKRGMKLDDLGSLLPAIQEYIRQGVSIRSSQGDHRIRFVEPRLMEAKLGVFLKSDFVLENVGTIPDALDVTYDLIFDQDPTHQAFLVIRHHWPSGIIDNEGKPYASFGPDQRTATMLLPEGGKAKGVWKLFKMGMQHVLTGIDHILFVLAAIVPFILLGRPPLPTEAQHPDSLSDKAILWIALFALGLIPGFVLGASGSLPLGAPLVEGAIALSIGVLAWSRLKNLSGGAMYALLIIAGLFHGLGFASVLLGKNLRGEYMGESMLGFSLGILGGVVAIMLLFYVVSRVLQSRPGYQNWIRYFLYLCLAISVYWLIERAFGIDLLIDTYIGKAFGKVFGIFHSH